MESKKSISKEIGHYENAHNSISEQDPFDYETLEYGGTGLRGLSASPYVFGAAFLASMGGFSFGYGISSNAEHNFSITLLTFMTF